MRIFKYLILSIFAVILAGCGQSDQVQELELVGHRGATGFYPENSIPGFKKALGFEVNSIEFDVVISGDEQVVISHDPWFRHDICVTPEGDAIDEERQMEHLLYEMTYEEIARYDCGSKQHPSFSDQRTLSTAKPLMKEAIREVESFRAENNYPAVKYNVEIKSNTAWDGELQPEPQKVAQLVYDELEDIAMLDQVRIFAFDERILDAFNELDSSVEQVYLIPQSKEDIAENLSNLSHQPEIYAPHFTIVDSALIADVHSRDMKIIPWTVNNYDDMTRLVKLGVDGLISDYPNHFEKLRNLDVNADKEAPISD